MQSFKLLKKQRKRKRLVLRKLKKLRLMNKNQKSSHNRNSLKKNKKIKLKKTSKFQQRNLFKRKNKSNSNSKNHKSKRLLSLWYLIFLRWISELVKLQKCGNIQTVRNYTVKRLISEVKHVQLLRAFNSMWL